MAELHASATMIGEDVVLLLVIDASLQKLWLIRRVSVRPLTEWRYPNLLQHSADPDAAQDQEAARQRRCEGKQCKHHVLDRERHATSRAEIMMRMRNMNVDSRNRFLP